MSLLLARLRNSNASAAAVTTLAGSGSGTAVLIFNASGSPTSTLAGSGSSTAVETFNGSGSPSTTLVGSGSGVATLIFNASGALSTTLAGSGSSTAVEVFNADGSTVNTTLAGSGAGTAINTPGVSVPKRHRGQIRFVDQPSLEKEPSLVTTKPEEETKQAEVYIPAVPDVPDVGIYTPDPFEISPQDWKKIVAKVPDLAQPVQRGRTRQQMEDEELLVMLMASAA